MTSKHKIEKFFLNIKSIRGAMVWYFSGLIIIALLISMLIAMNYTSKTVKENTITSSTQITRQISGDINSYIDYMENISSIFYSNQDVQNYLYNNSQLDLDINNEKDRIKILMNAIKNSRTDISNIGFIGSSGRYIVNDQGTMAAYSEVTKQDWFKKALESSTGMALSKSHIQNMVKDSYEWVITFSRIMKDHLTGKENGVFFIDLNYTAISNLCDSSKVGNKGYVFIIDNDGSLIYHPKQQLIYGGLKSERIKEVIECKDNYFIAGKGSDEVLYTMTKLQENGWTVVSVSYMTDLLKDYNSTQMLYILVALFLIILTLIISGRIARTITKPVELLRDSMEQVQQGNFANACIESEVDNEVGELSKSFNIMTEKIQQLMSENIFEQQQKRKSEIRALQSQMNPHFLYNTLDSIIWMAEDGKNNEVIKMTSALSKLLRQTISDEKEEISLKQEMDYLKNYLTIQKMRYKDQLEYEMIFEEDIWNVKIIKLVIQPIVENAIYHGIKYKEGMGFLYIHAYRNQDDVYIEISDDGVGMSETDLEHIMDKHKVNYQSNGIGIYNIQKRLQLYYGSQYGVKYTSSKGKGTTAIVKIPINIIKESDD